MTKFVGNSLPHGAASKAEITAFLTSAPPEGTLFLQASLAAYEDEHWWFGVRPLEGGPLAAVSCKAGPFTAMFASNYDAATALGDNLARSSRGHRDGKEHHVTGPKKIVDRFYSAFKVVQRDVVQDQTRTLMSAGEVNPGLKSARIAAARATPKDEPVLFDFLGEQLVERFGRDPRRLGKEGHRAFCQALTGAGRAVVGRQGVAPFMAAELVPMGGATLIERLFFPKPFRRTKLMGRGLNAVLALALADSDEAFFFADEPRPYLREVADVVGFAERETYRYLVLR